jgi:transcriptional regulator with XRE-family HTH domain
MGSPPTRPSLSIASKQVLRVLGDSLRAARLDRRLTQSALAERLGISRYTVMAMERGDPSVSIGAVVEAAAILGIPLVADDPRELAREAQTTRTLLRLLPARARRTPVKLDDDF